MNVETHVVPHVIRYESIMRDFKRLLEAVGGIAETFSWLN